MAHLGDFDASTVVYGKFTTYRPSTGATHTLAGTPALSVYKDNSTTQSTTGVTLTADFDSVTGLNHFAIDTSADGTFYSAGSFFDIVITTGTVDSVSVTGSVVGSFTIRKNSALKPTTAARTLDVSAGGEAGIDWANIGSPTTAQNLSGTNIDTDQVVASVTGAVGSVTGNVGGSVASVASNGISLASLATSARHALGFATTGTLSGTHSDTTADLGAGAPTSDITGQTLYFSDHDISRVVTAYNTGTGVATFDSIGVTLIDGNTWYRYPTAPISGGSGDATEAKQDTIIALIGTPAADLAADIAALDGKIDTIDTVADAIKAKTDNLPTDPADQSLVIAATDAIVTAIGDLPTNAELATALASADDAVLAAVATVDGNVDAIKAKTDSLTFTTAGIVDANVQQINDVTITGDGQVGTEFGVA